MPVTVIGNTSGSGGSNSGVRTLFAPLVEIKRRWTDTWTLAPFLQFLGATAKTGREGVGTCNLAYHYGPNVKEVYQTAFAANRPLDLRDYWVRITLIAANGVGSPAWIGRITGETREVYSETSQPAGKQLFTALEPLHLLERIFVSRSIWLEDGMAEEDALTVGFIPAMNGRDEWRLRVGNRSADTVRGTYVYGGSERWTREDYCHYVLEHFADEVDDDTPSASTGPGWVMGGQVSVLREVADIVSFGDSMSVADVLRKLIDARIGLDFKIVPTDFSGTQGGFEVYVFALNGEAASFGGQTMPKNPQTVTIKATAARDFENLTIVRDAAQRYGRIRVLGKRIVCALSLRGPKAEGGNADTPNLVKLWSAVLDTAYEAGGGEQVSDPAEHDLARTADKFAGVYQDYGAPDDWNHNEGAAAPIVNPSTGELTERPPFTPGSGFFAQDVVRKTLSFVPIQDDDGKFMEPQAWVYDPDEERYVSAKAAGCNGMALQSEWGLRVEANPNHLLAKDHFMGAVAGTAVDPKYDYEKMVITIAIETDQRIELIYETGEIAGSEWKPSNGELVIEDDTAELWYVAPGTVTQVDQNGKLVKVAGEKNIVVRNDVKQLYRWMAGAIGRYVNARGRADLTMRGWNPYTHAVGAILSVVDERGDSSTIQAPITSVEYGVSQDGSGTVTVIKAGFAR